jgi:hypothetical protein
MEELGACGLEVKAVAALRLRLHLQRRLGQLMVLLALFDSELDWPALL